MMKKILAASLAAIALGGCSVYRDVMKSNKNPYEGRMFYEKYLNPGDPLDAQIQQTLNALRANPSSPTLHNDLGQLLRRKGFPKDAEAEFERAVDADHRFYPAWYNLALLREARGNYLGAKFALAQTLRYKPGHAAALFHMGMMEERQRNIEAAIDYYAKSFSIDHAMLDVHKNPGIIDSKLVHLALLRAYPNEHARETTIFQPTPESYQPKPQLEAPSPQPTPQQIVPLAPPVTNPATQTPPPKPPSF